MKKLIRNGLLALTIAFGVVACDKNEMEMAPVSSQEMVNAGLSSKVSFGENAGIKVKNEAGKTASEFDHIYSPVAQSIMIMDSGDAIVFSGSYAAGDIASGITADSGYNVPIILENGSYSVATTNEGVEGIGYLPYSSSAAFDLDSTTGTIDLNVVHTHGFVIINVEDALENGRVTGATASLGGENPVALFTDAEFGDFYGYLVGGMNYDITANYNLNGVPTTRSELDKRIAIGLAYTFELGLTPDTPVSTRTVTETVFGQEDAIRDGAGFDVNGDNDLLDGLSRESSTIYTTTAGTEVAGTPTLGAWSVISDVDVSITTATVTSTEAILGSSINAPDTDLFDTIQKIVTTTTTSTNDIVDASNSVDGDWTIVGDYSSAGFGEAVDTSDADAQAEIDRLAQIEADRLAEVARLAAIAAQEAADAAAQAEVDRLAQVEADRLAQVEVDRLAEVARLAEIARLAEEAAAALAATPDTYTYSDWSGTAPAAQTVNGDWSPLTAESSVATISQSRSAVSVTASYEETRTATIQVNGDVDSPVPPTDSLTRSVPETRSPLANETRDIANPAFIPPSTDNGGSDVITASVSLASSASTIFGGSVTVFAATGDVNLGSATAEGRTLSFDFDFPAAGAYYVSYYTGAVALANGQVSYIDFNVAADGTVTIN